jgi:hypothetical protein
MNRILTAAAALALALGAAAALAYADELPASTHGNFIELRHHTVVNHDNRIERAKAICHGRTGGNSSLVMPGYGACMRSQGLAFIVASAPQPNTSNNVWARDDGRPGDRIQLGREFAGCHMIAMGSVPPRGFGTDWAAGISFNIQAGAAIDAIMGECMRSKGWIKQG